MSNPTEKMTSSKIEALSVTRKHLHQQLDPLIYLSQSLQQLHIPPPLQQAHQQNHLEHQLVSMENINAQVTLFSSS